MNSEESFLLLCQLRQSPSEQVVEKRAVSGELLKSWEAGSIFFDGLTTGYLQMECWGQYLYVENYSRYGAIAKMEGDGLKVICEMRPLAVTGQGSAETADENICFTDVYENTVLVFNTETEELKTADYSIKGIGIGFRDGDDILLPFSGENGEPYYLKVNLNELLSRAQNVTA